MKYAKKCGALEKIIWNVCKINMCKDSNLLLKKQLKLPSPVYIPGETLCP